MFKALFRKELREFLGIGVAGLAVSVLVAAMFGPLSVPWSPDALNYHNVGWDLGYDSIARTKLELPVPVSSRMYLSALSVLACGMGLLLGLAMSWKEDIKRTWPFLLFRPVTRSQVIGAKLLAALALYCAALAVPFALLAVWCAVPGNTPAPWSADYLYPGLDTLARGLVVLLGAFLSGLRPARWYGTRFAPLAAAALIVVLAAVCPSWPVSSAALLLGILLFLGAIWGVLGRAGRLRPALALIVTIGLTGMAALGGGFLMGMIQQVISMTFPAAPAVYERILFSPEGEPQIAEITAGSRSVKFKGLDGTVLGESVLRPNEAFGNLTSLWRRGPTEWMEWRKPWRPGLKTFSVSLVAVEPSPLGGSRFWYALWKEDLLVAYESRTRRASGYLGKNGFHAAKGDAEPFSTLLAADRRRLKDQSEFLVFSREGVYVLDLDTGALEPRSEEDLEEIIVIPEVSPDGAAKRAYLRREESITVYDPDGKPIEQFSLPKELAAERDLEVRWIGENVLGVVGDERYQAQNHSRYPTETYTVHIFKVARDGKVLARWDRSLKMGEIPGAFRQQLMSGLLPGMNPVGLTAVHLPAVGRFPARIEWPSSTTQITVLLKMTACGIAAFLLLRKRGLPPLKLWGWLALAFLFEIPAMLAIWALVTASEKRVACPSCASKRAPSTLACPSCGAGWPAPEQRATDLFSPA
jgi:hypothetical protein